MYVGASGCELQRVETADFCSLQQAKQDVQTLLRPRRERKVRRTPNIQRRKALRQATVVTIITEPLLVPILLLPVVPVASIAVRSTLCSLDRVMASYALYMHPRGDSLAKAIEEIPLAKPHISKIEEKKHWGGLLHMSLTGFAGINDKAPRGKRVNKIHSGDIFEAARSLTKECIHSNVSEFRIEKDCWNSGRRGKRNPNIYCFDVTGPCSTLGRMISVMNTTCCGNFEGVKLGVQDLHVSFSLDSTPEEHADVIVDFLSRLHWHVAVVALPSDTPNGEDLVIIKKFNLGK